MAKYEDYVKRELEDEIDEAAGNSVARQTEDDLPEQFKGKTAAEIARSYEELQTLQRRQANELGEHRKTIEQMVSQALDSNSQTEEPEAPLTVDDLYDDPEAAIARVVEKRTDQRVGELENKLAEVKIKEEAQALSEKHPNWLETIQTPEFQEWVAASPYRQRLAADADRYDFDAAADLLGIYNDHSGTPTPTADQELQRQRELDAAGLETGATTLDAPVETFSRAEYQMHKQLSQRGNRESELWLKQNGAAVMEAYASGNMTD